VSPSPGPAGVSNRTIRPPRLGAATSGRRPVVDGSPGRTPGPEDGPPDTWAHREREQAQGTLGTAAHDTRGPGGGQSRVPDPAGRAA